MTEKEKCTSVAEAYRQAMDNQEKLLELQRKTRESFDRLYKFLEEAYGTNS